ncbi:hypothetical protein A5721_33515 [Mycobacterium vulneris]|nr:hypothetical protein A5721_33515 [Mycolicibacterium vulneris]
MEDEFTSYLDASLLGKQIQIVTSDQLSAEEAELIPASWIELAQNPGRSAIEQTLSLWRQAIPGRLPKTLDIIDRCGHTVHLARVTSEPEPTPSVVLLYALHDPDAFTASFAVRIGFPPRGQSNLPDYWGQLPDEIRNLYHVVHDGFLTNLWAGPAGLIRSNDMYRLGEALGQTDLAYLTTDDAGQSGLAFLVCDEVSEQQWDVALHGSLPNIDRLVGICSNYGRARLLVDTVGDERDAWELWDGSLERWPNLWDRLDTWLVDVFVADGYREPGT